MSQWMTEGLHLQPQGDTDHSTSAALCPLAGLRKAICSASEAGRNGPQCWQAGRQHPQVRRKQRSTLSAEPGDLSTPPALEATYDLTTSTPR